MMLHRHFEKEKNPNMTTLADVTPKVEREAFASEIFPPVEPVDEPKKRGRKPKTAE